MAYDNTNSGALFKNTKMREGKDDPQYTGSINIDGKDYWLDAWVKESKDGKKYFSLRPRAKDTKPAPPARQRSPGDDDEEIPF